MRKNKELTANGFILLPSLIFGGPEGTACANESPMTSQKKRIGLFVLIVVFGFLLRIPYYFFYPAHVDEASHAANTVTLMNGGLPYADAAANNKPPALFGIYYASFLIFGKYSILGVRMMAFFWTLATALVLGVLASKISGKAAGLAAVAFYLIFTTALYSGMLAANSEIFMALPYALAALLFWQAESKGKPYLYFLSGAAAGLALLIKQVGGVMVGAAMLYLLLAMLIYGRKKLAPSLKAGALFGAGFVVPAALTGLLFYRWGVLDDALFWCFAYSERYISMGSGSLSFMSQIVVEFIPFVLSTILLWVLGVLWIKRTSAVFAGSNEERSSFPLFLVLWLISSIAATLVGKRMYSHYFIQILPPLCLIAALGAARYFTEKSGLGAKYWRAAIVLLTVVPALVFFGMTLSSENATNAWNDPQQDFRPAAEYIKAHTNPSDRIFVWGWFPPVYVYSERIPATRFVFTTMQTGYKPGNDPNEKDRSDTTWVAAPESWPMLKADLERNKPKLIIDTSPGNYHDFGRYPLKNYPILRHYVETHCRLETEIAGMDIYRCGN